jgi:hypothetical protein
VLLSPSHPQLIPGAGQLCASYGDECSIWWVQTVWHWSRVGPVCTWYVSRPLLQSGRLKCRWLTLMLLGITDTHKSRPCISTLVTSCKAMFLVGSRSLWSIKHEIDGESTCKNKAWDRHRRLLLPIQIYTYVQETKSFYSRLKKWWHLAISASKTNNLAGRSLSAETKMNGGVEGCPRLRQGWIGRQGQKISLLLNASSGSARDWMPDCHQRISNTNSSTSQNSSPVPRSRAFPIPTMLTIRRSLVAQVARSECLTKIQYQYSFMSDATSSQGS